MNKFLLWSLMAIMVITGCAKDQTTAVNNGHAIGFRAATTKATEIETYNLSSLYCTAIDANNDNYFTNVGFARDGEYFASSPAYYWPANGSTLKFWAYAPSSEAMGTTVSINAQEQLIKNFMPKTLFEDQVDFITATAQGSKENEVSGVALLFEHKLTQISVYGYNNNSEYIYKVYGVRIVNASTNATFDYSTDKWTFNGTDKATYSTLNNEPKTLNGRQELTSRYVDGEWVSNTAMIIPQKFEAWDPDGDPTNEEKGTYSSIALQITTKTGDRIFPADPNEDYGYVATPFAAEVAAGVKYVIYLNFTDGAGYNDPEFGGEGPALGETIKFTVKVNPWSEPSAGEIAGRQLEGNWKAKKTIESYIYPEDYPYTKNEPKEIVDADEVREYFGGNGFYEFTVDNKYMIHMTTPEGLKRESAMTIDDQNRIYLEVYKNPLPDANGEYGYQLVPVLQGVDEENDTSTTYYDVTNTNGDYEFIKRRTFIYDRY